MSLNRAIQLRRAVGFTLVELMVVIAIVSLLIALLVPAMEKSREAARAVICQSNLRQMSVALFSYRNDSKQFFPAMYASYTDRRGTHTRPFTFRLVPYLWGYRYSGDPDENGLRYVSANLDTKKNPGHLFYCPSALHRTIDDYHQGLLTDPSFLRNNAWLNGPSHDYNIATYGMISGLGYNVTTTTEWMRPKRSLTYPERTMVYVDGYREVRVDHSFRFIKYRHSDGANRLMGDLHVEHATQDQMTTDFTNRWFHLYDPNAWRYARW